MFVHWAFHTRKWEVAPLSRAPVVVDFVGGEGLSKSLARFETFLNLVFRMLSVPLYQMLRRLLSLRLLLLRWPGQ